MTKFKMQWWQDPVKERNACTYWVKSDKYDVLQIGISQLINGLLFDSNDNPADFFS